MLPSAPASPLAPFPHFVATTTTRSSTDLSGQHIRDLGLDVGTAASSRRRSVSADRASHPSIESDEEMASSNSGSAGSSGVSYGKPQVPRYDGKDDVQLFIDKLEVYYQFSGVADADKKAEILTLQCYGEAGQHVLAARRDNPHVTYNELKQSLVTRYGEQTHNWQTKLVSVHQSPSQSVSSYASRFRNHLLHAAHRHCHCRHLTPVH
jgi:hypothetical protein